jgi:hypothetical protein
VERTLYVGQVYFFVSNPTLGEKGDKVAYVPSQGICGFYLRSLVILFIYFIFGSYEN